MPASAARPRPVLLPEYCKGCGRCIDACDHHCIAAGNVINVASGLLPVVIDLERCTACGLCFEACPEPYSSRPAWRRSTGRWRSYTTASDSSSPAAKRARRARSSTGVEMAFRVLESRRSDG